MTRVLIVIDMQNDFINGSLGTEEAVQIIPQVIREIEEGHYDQIFATMDTHQINYLDTYEGKNLPVEHCIKDTKGWQLNPLVKEALAGENAVIIEKPTFGSEALVKAVDAVHPDEITLIGLCTDICVASNALMLRAAFHEIPMRVISHACAGVTPEKHSAALQVMASCQIEIQ